MTITEASAEELGLGEEQMPGFVLSMSREELRSVLNNPKATLAAYEATFAEYVNALQVVYFEQGRDQRCRTINNLAGVIKTEAECLLGYSVEPEEYIRERIAAHHNDPVSHSLREQGISDMPRVFTHTILDTIDAYMPYRAQWVR